MDAWEKLGYVFVLVVALLFIIKLSLLMFGYGGNDTCYILSSKEVKTNYSLSRDRFWSPDEIIASNLETFEDAIGKAQQISCEIR